MAIRSLVEQDKLQDICRKCGQQGFNIAKLDLLAALEVLELVEAKQCKTGGPGMPEISHGALKMVQEALERYILVVEASNCRPSSKRTYLLHARHFVRWLDGDFEPGGTLKRRR
jgi:hypothetical protein